MKNVFSDWQKIDLHIHTDWSKKTKENDYNGLFSVTRLKEKMIENGVRIFSLTDHNIINIDAYKEYYSNYDAETDPLLLLGVELDIEVNTPTRGIRTYHSLIIFNYSDSENTKSIYDKLEAKYQEKGLSEKERKLDIDDVIALFPEDDFFFIPHAGNTKSIIDGYKENMEDAQRMVLLMPSAFEKVKEASRQIYNEGFDKILDPEFQQRNDIPYINFSDNHNIEQYPLKNNGGSEAVEHEFYYIKGGKNFETLRLAFIDPESRIKSSEQFKEIIPNFNFIEKMKISNDNTLNDCELEFSPHLNVLIGGRSSGKSLMMSILGDKIDSIKVDKSKYGINYDDIEIQSKYDMLYKNSASITKDEIIFIKQGDIVRYFEEQKLNELAKESDKIPEYEDAKKEFLEHKRKLEEAHESFLESYNDCIDLMNQSHILHNSTIENLLSEDFVFSWNKNKVIENTDNTKKIEGSKELLVNSLENAKQLKLQSILKFNTTEIKVIENYITLVQAKIELIAKKESANEKKLNFIQMADEVIHNINQQLSQGARSKSEAKRAIESLTNNIGDKFESLVSLRENCNSFGSYSYELIESVSINDKVNLILEIDRTDSIEGFLLEGINGGDSNLSLYLNILDVLKGVKGIKNYTNNSIDSLRKKTRKQLVGIINAYDNPKDYLQYENGETSKKNSPGYNSEKYLEIILKNPKSKIIFIDQPEDNLGNRFITDTLVKLIREIKFNKQLFLVTHNPSIVVYGDAESIIIAENESNKISYKQVVLEHQGSQKEICGILDGGEYIFDMRAKKYNIKRILKDKENG